MSEQKQENNPVMIQIDHIEKEYKMFHRKQDRLIETIFPRIKRHENFKAMKDFNLTVNKGEVLGVLGKNGAGKSTLLKMITGVVTPTRGIIKVNGKISSLLELGAAFNMELTGIENIYQHGQVMGLTKEEIEERKQDIIDFADIGDHLSQPVKTYSSGMFARLAFACAINVDPDVLIVDEVLSVGDMAFQLKCFKKFEQFKEAGKTILFVSHNISDIIRNCTRAIIIDSGEKVFDGEVKDAVEAYKKIVAKVEEKDHAKEIEKEKANEEKKENTKEQKYEAEWQTKLNLNPNCISYGNGMADIIDFGIFDTKGNPLPIIENNKEVVLKSKVVFHEDVVDPIFTMTVKDFKGLDIMGSNSLYEKVVTGKFHKGEVAVAEFRQVLKLAPNKYTLSFSCTHFNAKGELEVLSRKYDAVLIEVMSDKDCVGLYRLDSHITVTRV